MTQMSSGMSRKWILVPGTLCSGQVFAPLLDELGVEQNACRIIVPDAPDVRDYTDRLREAVTGGEIVCGFSLGALILAHNLAALKHAHSDVLLASNPCADPPENRANRETLRDRLLAGGARDWVTENWATMSTSKREDLRNFVASMAEETVELVAAQTELAASRPGALDDLAETELPLIFVTGAEDQLTPPNLLSTVVDSAKHAQLHVIADLGHFALIEAPGQVAKAIGRSLKDIAQHSQLESRPHVT